jgi:hypothetical protein
VSPLLQQELIKPRQLRSQNETFIAEMKTPEIFVLWQFDHLSTLSPAETQNADRELARPPAPNVSDAFSYLANQNSIDRRPPSTTSRSKIKTDGAAYLPTPASVEPHRSDPNISVHLPTTGRDQSPYTEYKQHLRIKQAGNVIIAYDRKMKEFAIKEVKG